MTPRFPSNVLVYMCINTAVLMLLLELNILRRAGDSPSVSKGYTYLRPSPLTLPAWRTLSGAEAPACIAVRITEISRPTHHVEMTTVREVVLVVGRSISY